MHLTFGNHHYVIRLNHGYDDQSEDIEFDAPASDVAISRLDAIPNKRRAIVFEDGKKIADLSFLEGF